MNETNFIVNAVQLLVPQPCFDRFFVDFDFFNVECLKVVLSKGLGYGIILGAIFVKLPQILKLMKAKSGEGISLSSVTLELLAISANLAYGFRNKYPFSSYGDALFLAIQTAMIGFLVLYFMGNQLGAFGFLMVYGASMACLLTPISPDYFITGLTSANILIVILSKMIQALANYRNGSTGQLSAITVALLLLGSTARIFTSIQETGDNLIILTYIVATACNFILQMQIIIYWNVKTKQE